jgi:hypothetical protein
MISRALGFYLHGCALNKYLRGKLASRDIIISLTLLVWLYVYLLGGAFSLPCGNLYGNSRKDKNQRATDHLLLGNFITQSFRTWLLEV